MPKKIFLLAKELDINPLDLVETLKMKGFNVRNHMAELSDEDISKYLLTMEHDSGEKNLTTPTNNEAQTPTSFMEAPDDFPKTFTIAGIKYANRDGILRSKILQNCKKGQVLTLERDYRNKYDANAILILNDQGEDLGFVPKEIAKIYASQMDLGQKFEVSISDIHVNNENALCIITASNFNFILNDSVMAGDRLFQLVKNGSIEILKDYRVSSEKNSNGVTVLHALTKIDKLEITELVLQHPLIDKIKDNSGSTPLHWISNTDNLLIAEKVIMHPSIDKIKDNDGCTPLHNLAKTNILSIAEVVLQHPSVDKIKDNLGNTPLHRFEFIDSSIVDKLLLHTSVDKVTNNSGSTPIHFFASSVDNLLIAEKIIQHSSVDKIKNSFGKTPLHFLSRSDIKSILEMVLQHPLIDKVKDNDGRTPLHDLFEIGESSIIEKILKHPSMDKIKDNNGDTPLHLFAENIYMDEVMKKLFLLHSSTNEVKNNFGSTPLDVYEAALRRDYYGID